MGRFPEQFDSESFDTILQQSDFHKFTWKGNEADVKKGHFISIYWIKIGNKVQNLKIY